jgi:hypothetical protein
MSTMSLLRLDNFNSKHGLSIDYAGDCYVYNNVVFGYAPSF